MEYRCFIFSINGTRINNLINNYFGFNKQQRNGLLVLAFICFALLLVRIIYPYFISTDKISVRNLPLVEKKLDSAGRNNYFEKNGHSNENVIGKLFVFDPNSVSLQELLSLGFKEKTARIFLKFRGKGFVFKEKQDLKKVYGISDQFYSKLEPYILVGKQDPKKTGGENVVAAKKNETRTLELNSADSMALLELNGIGPSFAKRILKYKSLLGGYIKVEQLKEVYGFTDELYDKVKLYITVNPSSIKKLNLNVDDFKTVNRHPYLGYELTKVIFNSRRNAVITKENLKDVITDAAVYEKILPYLHFEN